MTTDTISPLRQRMIEDMNARMLSEGTQRGHIRACKRFAAFLKRSPDTAAADDVRRFQLHLIEDGASIHNRNRIRNVASPSKRRCLTCRWIVSPSSKRVRASWRRPCS